MRRIQEWGAVSCHLECLFSISNISDLVICCRSTWWDDNFVSWKLVWINVKETCHRNVFRAERHNLFCQILDQKLFQLTRASLMSTRDMTCCTKEVSVVFKLQNVQPVGHFQSVWLQNSWCSLIYPSCPPLQQIRRSHLRGMLTSHRWKCHPRIES